MRNCNVIECKLFSADEPNNCSKYSDISLCLLEFLYNLEKDYEEEDIREYFPDTDSK